MSDDEAASVARVLADIHALPVQSHEGLCDELGHVAAERLIKLLGA